MWTVIVLTVLAGLSAVIAAQHLAGRRQLDHREKQLQADWLARAGVELAAARLLTGPAGYTGEELSPLSGSQVRITVRREPDAPAVAAFGASTAGLIGCPQGPWLAVSALIPQKSATLRSFLVTSEVRYRTDEPPAVVRALSRRFRRVVEGDHVYLERRPPAPP
jgi:hypothetical protein